MHRRAVTIRSLVGLLAGAALIPAAAEVATAAHETGPEIECGGEHYVLRPDAGKWGAAKLDGTSQKFIAVRYTITAHTSAGAVYGPYLTEKGGGNAHPNQSTVDCTFHTFRQGIPDPVSGELVDVKFTIVVSAIPKG